MRIGAVLAGAGKEEEETVERIAADVGMAFQIQDDILDPGEHRRGAGKTGLKR